MEGGKLPREILKVAIRFIEGVATLECLSIGFIFGRKAQPLKELIVQVVRLSNVIVNHNGESLLPLIGSVHLPFVGRATMKSPDLILAHEEHVLHFFFIDIEEDERATKNIHKKAKTF